MLELCRKIFIKNESKKIDEGSIHEILLLTYPLILSTLSGTLMQFTNRIFVAWSSADALSALIPATFLSFTISSFFYGLALYTNVFVAQFHGAKKNKELILTLWQAIWLSLISFFAIIALIPLGHLILNFSDHDPSIKIIENKYYTLISCGYALLPIITSLSSFFSGRGKTKITMYVNVFGNILNVLICYSLVFGIGPFPKMGIFGAAIAFIISNFSMLIIYLAIILSKKNDIQYETRKLMTINTPMLSKLIKFGIPNGLEQFIDIAAFTVFVFIVGNINKSEQAASNILVSINALAFMPVMGMGIATTILIGQYIGRNKKNLVTKILKNTTIVFLLYVAIVSAFFILYSDFFINLFSEKIRSSAFNDVFVLTRELIVILPFYLGCEALNILMSSVIRGSGDTKFQMLAMISCAWLIFIPGEYTIISIMSLNVIYAWIWAIFYLLIFSLILFLRYRSGHWKNIHMV